MIISQAQFLQSNTDYKSCPAPDKPEYAFIGRSNVGKSSLINMLTNHSKLAKVSAKPGKTRLINHFLINNLWYLVDLPGIGYAKISKSEKATWNIMTQEYLKNRENLMCVFMLIDSRLEPQKIDLDFIGWLGNNNIPIALVFTKTDKQTVNKTQINIDNFHNALLEFWEELPQYFITSSITYQGKDDILSFIDNINKDYSFNK